MRGKRSKQYRKLMHAYALAFNFREPYQVLLDAEIIRDAERCKMKLGSMLQNTLHGEIKPMITQCCIRHLYNAQVDAGQKAQKEQWIEVAKQAERRRCGHHALEEPLSALECIKSVVDPKGSSTNKHRYVVASQDTEVRDAMRQIAGVPLIYVNRSVMILEPLATKTEQVRNADEISKRKAGLKGRQSLVSEKRKRDDDDDDGDTQDDPRFEQPASKRKKIRGPKGPNPLSVKKSKKASVGESQHSHGKASRATTDPRHPSRDSDTKSHDTNSVESGHRKRKRKRQNGDESGVQSTSLSTVHDEEDS